MKKALFFGILASFFFAFTFLLNRSMNLSGGYWMWSAVLRYLMMLPLLALLLWHQGGAGIVLDDIKKQPLPWFIWSTVGFGLFYLPLTCGSIYGESWFVAATWQITIVCGVLLTPFFGKKIPFKNLFMSCIILAGIFLLQIPEEGFQTGGRHLIALIPILMAAFAYPLGNRKMMQYCPENVTTMQRVFGMTLCSMPFWLVFGIIAMIRSGLPSSGQLLQSFGVALFSGVIATILFFYATDLVKHDPKKLAVVEATQSGEVIFTLLGGILILGDRIPGTLGILGLILIIGGMIANSLLAD